MANTTWNPSDKTAGVTLSNLNLTATASGTSAQARSVDRQVTGKFYWEYTFVVAANMGCGVANPLAVLASLASNTSTASVNAATVSAGGGGGLSINGVASGISVGAFSNGGVACFALDLDSRLLWVRNGAAGNWNNSAANNPATGVGGASVPIVGRGLPAHCVMVGTNANPSGQITANFGDTAFAGTVPSGFTSGFTAGASIPTNALATQIGAEHWASDIPAVQLTQVTAEHWATTANITIQAALTQIAAEHYASATTNLQAQLTQIAAEHWASSNSVANQAVLTQIAIEHWASVATIISHGGPMITMIG